MMTATQQSISPQNFLEELRQLRLDLKAEVLTAEGRQALLKQVNEMETLVRELKMQLLAGITNGVQYSQTK